MERSSTHKMFFRREEKKLARVQRALSRKKKGSANRQKAKRKVNTVHYRIKCRRKNYAHRTTTSIAKRVRFIGVESLNIAGMMKDRRQAKSVADQATGQFLELLPYKVEARGAGRCFPQTTSLPPLSNVQRRGVMVRKRCRAAFRPTAAKNAGL